MSVTVEKKRKKKKKGEKKAEDQQDGAPRRREREGHENAARRELNARFLFFHFFLWNKNGATIGKPPIPSFGVYCHWAGGKKKKWVQYRVKFCSPSFSPTDTYSNPSSFSASSNPIDRRKKKKKVKVKE
eukprot:TRINITY_DN2221_c2_g2_i1.p2 TRINITY_DN2221_c2_g2~~TRINITY_DN2221_c2_g2_i1.p2  ORF type:complete len:129 (-),score=11.64 TRINITY_DN2221_c2_g2_i1:86-472(-)